jgi:hypothetical protein
MAAKDIKPYQFTSEKQPKQRRSRRGVPNRSTILKRWLNVRRVIEADRNPTGKSIRGTVEDEIMLALIDKALKGDVAAIREVLDTRYGKAKEHQDVNLSVNLETDADARLQRARAALAKLQREVDSMIDSTLSNADGLDREEVRRQTLALLPQWCAEDWSVDVRLLCDRAEQDTDNKAVGHED